MKMMVELDWDSVDNITIESLKSHYDIVGNMLDDPNRIVDYDYNLKLRNSLAVVLEYFGLDVENGKETETS